MIDNIDLIPKTRLSDKKRLHLLTILWNHKALTQVELKKELKIKGNLRQLVEPLIESGILEYYTYPELQTELKSLPEVIQDEFEPLMERFKKIESYNWSSIIRLNFDEVIERTCGALELTVENCKRLRKEASRYRTNVVWKSVEKNICRESYNNDLNYKLFMNMIGQSLSANILELIKESFRKSKVSKEVIKFFNEIEFPAKLRLLGNKKNVKDVFSAIANNPELFHQYVGKLFDNKIDIKIIQKKD